jgi:hypothetical protein
MKAWRTPTKALGMMGQQQDLRDMYHDPETAFGPDGVAAGNDALSVIFGSPEVSRAVTDHAQKFSGVSSGVLKKLLPVLAGMVVSGLMRSGSAGKTAAPAQPTPSAGNLGDILGQIFGRGMPGSVGAPADNERQLPRPASQPSRLPTEPSGQTGPDGDLLGTILRELEKGIRDGRVKPGSERGAIETPLPDRQQRPLPSDPEAPQVPGGDIFGQIFRDVFGGAVANPSRAPQVDQRQPPQMKDLSEMTKQLGVMGGAGAAVFGNHFEVGRDVEKSHIDNLQVVFDRFLDDRRR